MALEKVRVTVRGWAIMIYDILVEWIKLTTTILIFLAVPLSLYIAWDIITSDLSFGGKVFRFLGGMMTDNLGIYLLALLAIIYLTYLQRMDIKKEESNTKKALKTASSFNRGIT